MAVVTKNTPEISSAAAQPRRRWYQFTLRTAAVWMVLLCLLLGSFAWWRDRAERQRKVVEELRGLGGTVLHSNWKLDASGSKQDLASFARSFLGDDYFYNIDHVEFIPDHDVSTSDSSRVAHLLKQLPHLLVLVLKADITPSDIESLPCLENLKSLIIRPGQSSKHGQLSDKDLVLFERCVRLEYLVLEQQRIKGEGLPHLQKCPNLQTLHLPGNDLMEEYLENLSRFDHLKVLGLSDTTVNDRGLAKVQLPRSLECIFLARTAISDATLEHLQKLPNLTQVNIVQTSVTTEAIERFESKKPNCSVWTK